MKITFDFDTQSCKVSFNNIEVIITREWLEDHTSIEVNEILIRMSK